MVHTSLAALLLRLGMSLPMMTHGWPKLQRVLDGNWKFGDPIGLGEPATLLMAVFSEFICPLLIVIGFKTRFFSIFPAITMLVAAFVVHADDPWRKQELPLLFLVGFLAIIFIGPGRYSVDEQLKLRA